MNLVSNAAEAMPDGGRIHVITENFYSDIPMPDPPPLNKGEYVKLIIRDEGIGISDEDKERIFEPFYTKKTMGRSGSGLGMALVWGAVQDHNGHIDIQSAPGKGTAVIIFFPAVRAQSHEARTDSSLEKFKGKGETILVVDDLEDQRYLAAEMLTRLGYSVKAVPSGEAAVEHLKTCPADLVLLDMIMRPGINGLETYKKILTLRPSQKAIIVTGFSTSDRIKAAQSLGAGPCLKKPYLLHDMARIVREELDR
jgi:CheY-like chemotaxis protein